ncbi:hypothetical protein BDR03DRAFT_1043539 [Suillus americanus]|nr:hypothetical protein BDR03DRAFT_1043539 [Suillus americanus]
MQVDIQGPLRIPMEPRSAEVPTCPDKLGYFCPDAVLASGKPSHANLELLQYEQSAEGNASEASPFERNNVRGRCNSSPVRMISDEWKSHSSREELWDNAKLYASGVWAVNTTSESETSLARDTCSFRRPFNDPKVEQNTSMFNGRTSGSSFAQQVKHSKSCDVNKGAVESPEDIRTRTRESCGVDKYAHNRELKSTVSLPAKFGGSLRVNSPSTLSEIRMTKK